jgi:hypothetical protein
MYVNTHTHIHTHTHTLIPPQPRLEGRPQLMMSASLDSDSSSSVGGAGLDRVVALPFLFAGIFAERLYIYDIIYTMEEEKGRNHMGSEIEMTSSSLESHAL